MSDDELERLAEPSRGPAHPEAALACEIRLAREAAGLTQGQLANAVGFSREYVSRAERPSKGLASRELVEAIDAALGAGGALVMLRARLHEQRLARRRSPQQPTKDHISIDLRTLLVRGLTILAAQAVADSSSCDVAPEDHAVELTRLQSIDRDEGPERALPGVMALLDTVGREVADSRGVDRRVLLGTASRAAEFAGFLHRDLGDPKLCLYWHDRAMESAQQARDRPLQAYVLLRKAQAAYDQRDAPRMLDLTLAAATAGTVLGVPYFSILMATSLALAGEPDEAARIACASLPTAVATTSRRSIREARSLVGVLTPWQGRHHVRELRDALRSAEGSSRC